MRKILCVLTALLLIWGSASAEFLFEIIQIDGGYSINFNRAVSANQENWDFEKDKLELDLLSFEKMDDGESFRGPVGNHSVAVYGIEEIKSPINRPKMSYFSISTVVSFESDEVFQEALLEFLILSHAAVLASDNSFTTEDADVVLFEKLDAKKLFAEHKNEFSIEHKGNNFLISSTKDPILGLLAIIELKLFPKLK